MVRGEELVLIGFFSGRFLFRRFFLRSFLSEFLCFLLLPVRSLEIGTLEPNTLQVARILSILAAMSLSRSSPPPPTSAVAQWSPVL